jgi:hypothetical protein
MAPTSFPYTRQTVQPVHPIQALHNRDALPAQAPQTSQVTRATDYQHSLVRRIGQVLADLDATRAQPIRKLILE